MREWQSAISKRNSPSLWNSRSLLRRIYCGAQSCRKGLICFGGKQHTHTHQPRADHTFSTKATARALIAANIYNIYPLQVCK